MGCGQVVMRRRAGAVCVIVAAVLSHGLYAAAHAEDRRPYPAVVLDVGSRRVIGWASATHLRTARVLATFRTSIACRSDRSR
jgi:transposase InsO family protein